MSATEIKPAYYNTEQNVVARLNAHEVWLNTQGAQGEPARFENVDLSGISTLFRDRNLRKIVFSNVDLDETSLVDSDLSGVDLRSAQNLVADQFAGAVLRNAGLPEHIDFSAALDSVEEVTKVAGQILASLLIACVYSWLTIASTRDAELLANRATSSLPLIGVTIPIVSFYFAAPIVLLGGISSIIRGKPRSHPTDREECVCICRACVSPHLRVR